MGLILYVADSSFVMYGFPQITSHNGSYVDLVGSTVFVLMNNLVIHNVQVHGQVIHMFRPRIEDSYTIPPVSQNPFSICLT